MKRTFYVSNVCIHAETKLNFPALETINDCLNEISPRNDRTENELLEAYARSYILMNCDISFDFEEIDNDKIQISSPDYEWSADLADCEGLPEQEYEIKLSYPKSLFIQYDGDMTEYKFLPKKERNEQLVYDYIKYFLPLKVKVIR